MEKRILQNVIAWAVALAVIFAVWSIAYFGVGNALIVPSFLDCARAFFALLSAGAFYKSLFATLLRVVFAFVLSFVLAGVFALGAYLSVYFAKILAPILALLRCVPVLAVLLVFLLWVGADSAPVLVAVLTLLPIFYTAFYTALMGVDKELLEMSKVFCVPKKRQIKSLYLPALIRVSAREASAGFALGLKLVVSAEVLAQTAKSLGGRMQEAKIYLDIPLLFALVLVVSILGIAVEILGGWIDRKVERRMQ